MTTGAVETLPDVDWVKGMTVQGQIVEIQYENVASGKWYSLQMTLPNAQYLLVLLSHLPGAEGVLAKSEEFDKRQGS